MEPGASALGFLGVDMKVTIIKRPFRQHAVGDVVDVSSTQGKLLVHIGRASYQTRMMTAGGAASDAAS